ncbi:MAG: class I SAM-dependent methyltransferase [Candidatus Zixiibacteriota bacterium]|nr:MAG: class I SAM-dependent methyltransferase [candidate division Zixibacteria bacterium]
MNTEMRTLELKPDEIFSRFDPDSRRGLYYDLLLKENRKINLVSRETSVSELERLTAESLVPLTLLDVEVSEYLDIGSGGGIPSVPILLSGVIQGKTTLVERTGKKAAALRRILMALGLDARILKEPYETTSLSAGFDLITMRLVKLTPRLLDRSLSLLAPQGLFVCFSRPSFDISSRNATSYSYSLAGNESPGVVTVFKKA